MTRMLITKLAIPAHINNLYNTSFWALVQLSDPPLSTTQAHEVLSGTYSKDKNEILFSRFGINYGKLPERYKKGSVLVRQVSVTVLGLMLECGITDFNYMLRRMNSS